MYSFCLSNLDVHPVSHSWHIDSREPDARCGEMCARCACVRSCGILSINVCVAVIVALFGRMTLMPLGVGVMFVIGMFVCTRFISPLSSCCLLRNVPVTPVSATSGLLLVLLFVIVVVL